MSSLDALLGKVFNDGEEIELGGGLDFKDGLVATRNPTTKRIEIAATGGGGGGGSGLGSLEAIRIAAVTNIALTGVYTHQGEALAHGDRVGAFGQTDGTAGGIYVVNSGGAWARSDDFNEESEVVAGAGGLILEGTYNGGTWTLITDGALVGVTALSFQVDPFVDVAGADGVALTVASGVPSLTKIGNAHVTDNTLALSKLTTAGAGDADKVPVVNGAGVLALAVRAKGHGMRTDAGVALTTRDDTQAEAGVEFADAGGITRVRLAAYHRRVKVRVVRTDNITNFEAVPLVAGGHTLAKRHTFLAIGQTNPAENGLYWDARHLNGTAWCYRLASLEELAADGGLHVWITGGSTGSGTIRKYTNFATNTYTSQPLPHGNASWSRVDIEDYATAAEIAANTNWEPAFRRAQEALGDDGCEILLHRQRIYASTSTWKFKRKIGIRGVGSPGSTIGSTLLSFAACTGLLGQLQLDMRQTVRALDASGGTVTGLGTRGGVSLADGDRVLRVTPTTTLTASYVQPAVSANVQIQVTSTTGYAPGRVFQVLSGGAYEVVSVDSGTLMTVENLGTTDTKAVGETVSIGSEYGDYVGGDPNDGFWVAHSGAWTRPTDYDTTSECDPGLRVYVSAGTSAGTAWEQRTQQTGFTLGTGPLLFTQATELLGIEDTDATSVRVSNLAIQMTGTPGDLDKAHGVECRTSFVLRDVYIDGFSGNCVEMRSSGAIFPPSGGNTNQFDRVIVSSPGLNGFRLQGGDSNTALFRGCTATSCGTRGVVGEGWGFKDDSYLGSTYIGCTAASNFSGSFEATGAAQNNGLFLGCYEEGDNNCDISAPNVTLNCRFALRVGATSTQIPGFIPSTSDLLLSPFTVKTTGTPGVDVARGALGTNTVDRFKTIGAGDTSGYTFGWQDSGGDGASNCWGYAHAGGNSRRAFMLTGPSHGRSHSHAFMRTGALIGGPAAGAWLLHAVGSTADIPVANSTSTGAASRWEGVIATGDVMWNAGYVPGTGLPNFSILTNTAGTITRQDVFVANDAAVDLTAQTASIGSTALLTAPAAGLYEVNVYLECTTADVAAGTVQVTIGYTDRSGARTQATAALLLTATGSTSNRFLIRRASGNVTYTATVVTAGSAQYALTVTAKRIL